MIELIWIVCGLYAYWLWRQNSSNEPPEFPGALPLIGHAHRLIGSKVRVWRFIKELTDVSNKIGGVIYMSFGPWKYYIVTDPDDVLTVSNTCLEKDAVYEFSKPWVGQGLVTAKVHIWRNHRKLLSPAFSQVVLNGFMDVFNKQARVLVRSLAAEEGKGTFDSGLYIRHNALETVGLTVLGVDFTDESMLQCDYVQTTYDMFGMMVKRLLNLNVIMRIDWMYSWTSMKRKQDELLKKLHKVTFTVIQKRKSELQKNGFAKKLTEKELTDNKLVRKFEPFLDLLLELAMENNAFSDQEIRNHVDTIIVAGHDTYSTALINTLVMLGSYPEAQEKVYNEIEQVIGKSDRDVEKHDLSRLVYLEAVIKESIRMNTPVPAVARRIDRKLQLKSCTLSAGRTCFILLHGTNRNPIWGEDAQEFRPERWLDPATMPDNPNAFAGFSIGIRNCIAKAYALMVLKTTLAHVLRRYRVKADWTKLVFEYHLILKPVSGHHIAIESRV